MIGDRDDDPSLGPKIRIRGSLIRDWSNRIPIHLGKLDLLEGFSLVFEAEKGGGIADIPEKEEGGDGADQNQNSDDFVEILREPCGEI